MSLNSDKATAAAALRMVIAHAAGAASSAPPAKFRIQPDEGTLKKLNLPVGRNLQSFKANTAPYCG